MAAVADADLAPRASPHESVAGRPPPPSAALPCAALPSTALPNAADPPQSAALPEAAVARPAPGDAVDVAASRSAAR